MSESIYNFLLDAVGLCYGRTERQFLSNNDQVFCTTSKSDENHKSAQSPHASRCNLFLQLESFLIIGKLIKEAFLIIIKSLYN